MILIYWNRAGRFTKMQKCFEHQLIGLFWLLLVKNEVDSCKVHCWTIWESSWPLAHSELLLKYYRDNWEQKRKIVVQLKSNIEIDNFCSKRCSPFFKEDCKSKRLYPMSQYYKINLRPKKAKLVR